MTPYYEHAGITIYHGDCREVLPTLSLTEFAVIVDPPYGIEHSSNYGASWNGTSIANDSDTSVRDSIVSWSGSSPAAVFGSWKVTKPRNIRGVLIWDKGPASGMGDLAFPWKPSWEEIYILGDGWNGRRDEGVLKGHIVVTWETKGRQHPNQKPVSLIAHLIHKTTAPLIIDPCIGSGSTLEAAKLEGRQAIGIEVDERWCEVSANRLAQEVLPI